MTEVASIVPASAPTVPNPAILFGPNIDLPVRLAGAGAKRRMQRAVLRPIDLTASHGLVVKAENIHRLAATYDPTFEMAMLNFDHEWGGPAHGHCLRLFVEGDLLWTDWGQLSDAAIQGMESGQWPRVSSEFWVSHPQTKDWYFTGLALLGSKSPAVPGLPPERWLMSRPVYRLINLEETRSETSEHAAPANGEETTEDDMSKKNEETPAGAETKTPETTAAVTPPATAAPATAGTDPEVAELAAKVEGQLAGIQADRQALATQLATLRLERAELAADKTLSTRLDKKLTPAQAKLARPLFIALAALEVPTSVQLAAADGKPVAVPVLERIVEILSAGQDYSALFGRVAEATPGEQSATALSAAEMAAGLTPEEAARIEAKYPTSFTDAN